ncbi:hypothetical protein [Cupriavidus sp. WS]|uniref:hypothetical protein n=1 Tax=Cupriavidus sp. WS TaxID=1312922 RepID=UPI00036F786D|nr:hypothetical protein [Cupriavidus sp. WS]
MNKILIVGHHSSQYQDVERLLNECGMSRPLPSRREKLMPVEIGATLLKAHGVSPLNKTGADGQLQQIEASPIWHGMALDLMLGNLDQTLWGWADPQAVHLLDYWKSLDPRLTFILAYDSPRSLLAQIEDADTKLTHEHLRQRIHDWSAYNAALLHFFHRNTDRSLLVHTGQVRLSANHYLQQVRARIGAPLNTPLGIPHAGEDEAQSEQRSGAAHPEGTAASATSRPDDVGTPFPPADALSEYLSEALLQQFPQAQQIYEELQSVADLPLIERVPVDNAALGAWRVMAARHVQLNSLRSSLAHTQEALDSLRLDYRHQREKAESLMLYKRLATERLARLGELGTTMAARARFAEAQSAQLKEAQGRLATERETGLKNALLHAQLKQAHEELERCHLEAKLQRETIASLTHNEALAAERLAQLGELKLRVDAGARLADDRASQVKEMGMQLASRRQLEQENELLLKQLYQIQTELERSHLECKQQRERVDALLSSEKLAIEGSEELAELRLRLADHSRQAEEQGRIDIRQELEQENQLLFKQLHQMQEEQERHHREMRSAKVADQLKTRNFRPALEYRGAADRIKHGLTYRLGTTMILRSRSIGGWITMPWALLRETRQFRAEAAKHAQLGVPLHEYRDVHEAERAMRHLSYRLGAKLLAGLGSPLGWLKLPMALRREVKAFRQERTSRA